MKRTQNELKVLSWCETLAKSQGFYGRLLEELYSDPSALSYLAEQNFSSMLDMVLFLES